MKFHSFNHHKSGFLEQLASNFAAIAYIDEFRKQHRKLFDTIFTAAIMATAAMLLLFAWMAARTLWGVISLIAAIGFLSVWLYYRSRCKAEQRRGSERKRYKQKNRKQPSPHFMELIDQGYRVYDGYFFHAGDHHGGDYPAKFSVFSKKHLNKKSMQKLMPVSDGYIGVVRNTHTSDCRYITFNGSDVHAFDSATGKCEKTTNIHFEKSIARYITTEK